jgi:hypothetical protein
MLNSRIKSHKSFMLALGLFHCFIAGVSAIEAVKSDPRSQKKCNLLHFSSRLLYVAMNLALLFYFWHLSRHAKLQSMDIYIFDHQLKIIRSLWLMPLVLWGHFFVTDSVCPGEPFPFAAVLAQFLHLTIELFLVYAYVGWYQSELKRYSGAEVQSEDLNSKSHASVNK